MFLQVGVENILTMRCTNLAQGDLDLDLVSSVPWLDYERSCNECTQLENGMLYTKR